MATTYRIHPAIGVARVGNSPGDFFVGPERIRQRPQPTGGFKDDECRVKRQAARFRIYAHHDDGSVEEVTASQADISWTVHLVNRKAAHPNRGNSEPATALTIDPGQRTLVGPDASARFDTGTIAFSGQPVATVPLGEIRTDDDGRLLVLGGAGHSASPANNLIGGFWGNAGWYDDISDGSVTASITLEGSGDTPAVDGAWVLVAPPKFAPHQDSVTTLFDRLLQRMIDLGLVNAPTTTSYTDDIYPILERAREMKWVETTFGAHTWADPVTSQSVVDAIVGRVGNPGGGGGDMPDLNGSDSRVTPTQYAHLQRWQAGAYANDWTGVPAAEATVSPEGLDRAALEACVGGAFFPGIEAGGLNAGDRPILEKPYTAAFRIDHSQVNPGDISQAMALPWQADFNACADNWWPVPRPNDVYTTPGGSSVRWSRDVANADEMVSEWNRLGFVVEQGADHLETQHCDELSITLLTPHLDFLDVPQGPMNMVREIPMAITFEVVSPSAALTFQYATGGAPNHPQLVAATTSDTVGPTAADAVASAQLWIVFRTDVAGNAIATQTVTVQETVTGRTWQVTIDGNTVARVTTATALTLDRSGSMSDDRGDGQSKHDSLQQAANMFVDLMLAGDGVGIVRFNSDAQVLQNVLELDDGGISDLNRGATHDIVNGNGLDPSGNTSIGDGIYEARGILDAASGFDQQALVVLTDGLENSPRWISDVASQIDAKTYAVGLGQPQNISTAALQTLSGNNGGYLLTTGAISGDNRFALQKYFLQILSGINNADIVLDPTGVIRGDDLVRIPFRVNDADTGVEVVLLTPLPNVVDFRLQTPNGLLIEPWQAAAEPGMQFGISDGSAFYRIALPVQPVPGRFEQVGTWHAVFRLGKPRTDPAITETDRTVLLGRPRGDVRPPRRLTERERSFALTRGPAAAATNAAGVVGNRRALPYSLVVHAYSNLSLTADLEQDSHRPGGTVTVGARVTQSGLPIADANVWAEVSAPDDTIAQLAFEPNGDAWAASFVAARPGTYRVRVRARGRTRAAVGFDREQTLTATTWRGAGDPGDPASSSGGPSPRDPGGCLCDLLECLFGGPDERGALTDEFLKRLAELGIDVKALKTCIEKHRERDDRDAR